jgi:polyhydroxyalkanoate synthesis regulator protein
MSRTRKSRKPIVIRFLRCYSNKIAIMVDANLERHGLDELRRWAARRVKFVVIDDDTGEDITRILLA